MKHIRLKQARKAMGLSREAVAEAMHKSPHTIKSWEAANRQPRNMREIEKLCRLLNITVHWYLDGTKPIHPIRTMTTEHELLTLFSELSEEQQEAVLRMMRVMG
ncbi:helix-turn-helix transcriptional regulator [Vibrio sp. PP-XX7]